ncbi:30S ribosomal protein S16 [Candidatus Woesebacteria bacterium]|nr:30S ribosomal protein S16 [Candidatus Woesebacteria bacterium]
MLKIKLARFGKRNQPVYRIVVNEAKDKRDGAYTALVGHYAPTQSPKILQVDLEVYRSWIAKGAQPTDTVAALVKRFESGKPFPPKKKRLSQKAKAKAAAAEVEAKKPKEEKVEAVKTEAVAEVAVTPEEKTEVADTTA